MLSNYQPSPDQIKILVVDDEPVNAKVLAEILEDEGYQTAIAGGGQEALHKVATERPSVVLLDVMMPDNS